jgi:hypothetical protein
MRVAPASMRNAMTVIYAETKFRCRHRYIATAEQQRLLFVCDQCQHRTEQLPLDRGAPLCTVMPFPLLADAAHPVRRERDDVQHTSDADGAADRPA